MRYNVISKKKIKAFLAEAKKHPSFVIDEVAKTLNMDRDEAISIYIYLVQYKFLKDNCASVQSLNLDQEMDLWKFTKN